MIAFFAAVLPVTLGASLTTSDVWIIAVIAVLLLLLSFLAMAETALNRISITKAQSLAGEGKRNATALLELVREPERFLNPVILAVNIAQVVQAVLTGVVANQLFGATGVVIGTILNVGLFFVMTEALPKTWAVLYPERGALLSARPVSWLVRFWPLRILSKMFIGITNWIIPGKGLAQGPFVNEAELLHIVHAAANDEVIEHDERELIESVIEFGDTIVREVMVPRADMVTVDATASVNDALSAVIEEGFSRVPVIGHGIDDIVGLVYLKDLVRAFRRGQTDEAVSRLARRMHFVPETKKVVDMLREMQAGKFHMALAVDEYGGTAGLVTLEDLLEELVGDINDEFDLDDPDVVSLGGGAMRVHGRMSIDELSDVLDTEFPADDWDTVGGLIFNMLGHVPTIGEEADVLGYRFRVDRMQGRRIMRVRIAPAPPEESADDVGSGANVSSVNIGTSGVGSGGERRA